jgi:[acyl-carrier-protein] S-malonyltransferase
MAEASALTPSSMAAVLGGDESSVLKALDDFGLEPANFNGAGQIVAAGSKGKILQLVENPPERAKVIELKVAGAFHTSFMATAVDKVKGFANQLEARQPEIRIWTNATGKEVSSGQQFLDLIVNQIAQPVRWDHCMESLNHLGSQVIELPPAGALAGLLKRGADKVHCVALKSPADLVKVIQ